MCTSVIPSGRRETTFSTASSRVIVYPGDAVSPSLRANEQNLQLATQTFVGLRCTLRL